MRKKEINIFSFLHVDVDYINWLGKSSPKQKRSDTFLSDAPSKLKTSLAKWCKAEAWEDSNSGFSGGSEKSNLYNPIRNIHSILEEEIKEEFLKVLMGREIKQEPPIFFAIRKGWRIVAVEPLVPFDIFSHFLNEIPPGYLNLISSLDPLSPLPIFVLLKIPDKI